MGAFDTGYAVFKTIEFPVGELIGYILPQYNQCHMHIYTNYKLIFEIIYVAKFNVDPSSKKFLDDLLYSANAKIRT